MKSGPPKKICLGFSATNPEAHILSATNSGEQSCLPPGTVVDSPAAAIQSIKRAFEKAGQPVDVLLTGHGVQNAIEIGKDQWLNPHPEYVGLEPAGGMSSEHKQREQDNLSAFITELKGKVKSIHVNCCSCGAGCTPTNQNHLASLLATGLVSVDSPTVTVIVYDQGIVFEKGPRFDENWDYVPLRGRHVISPTAHRITVTVRAKIDTDQNGKKAITGLDVDVSSQCLGDGPGGET